MRTCPGLGSAVPRGSRGGWCGRTAHAVTLPVRPSGSLNRVSDEDLPRRTARASGCSASTLSFRRLAIVHVRDNRLEVAFPEHVPPASAARPPPWGVVPVDAGAMRGVERTGGPRLEVLQDRDRSESRCRDDHMHVLRSAACRVERPAPTEAGRRDAAFNGLSLFRRQHDRACLHPGGHGVVQMLIRLLQAPAGVGPASRIARQPRSIRGPREEVGERFGSRDRAGIGPHTRSVRMNTLYDKPPVAAFRSRKRAFRKPQSRKR
jgi:hypothetical protein